MAAASNAELQAALPRYDEVLTLKNDKLAEWDAWYRGALREAVRERARSKEGAYITRDELIQLMQWKLTRGKFRPMLQQYAASNTDALVRKCTGKGFALLKAGSSTEAAAATPGDAPPTREVIVSAIKAISELKGVGPAMASALLALDSPRTLPYMSDEMLAHGVGLRDKPKYNEKEYIWLVEHTTQRLQNTLLNGSGSSKSASQTTTPLFHHDAEQLEMAAWAFGVLKVKGMLDVQVVRKTVSKRNNSGVSPSAPSSKRARKR